MAITATDIIWGSYYPKILPITSALGLRSLFVLPLQVCIQDMKETYYELHVEGRTVKAKGQENGGVFDGTISEELGHISDALPRKEVLR